MNPSVIHSASGANDGHGRGVRGANDDHGLLVIGHGTRHAEGAEQFLQLIEQLRRQVPDRPVEGCFLELRPPTIETAWRQLVERGVRHVQALPLLLFSAGHAKRDIPDALADCAAGTPGVSFHLGRALSRHRGVLQRSCQCVLQAAGTDASAAETVLVMVGRGSYDVCAQADMRLFSECVFRTVRDHAAVPFAAVETAFYAMAEPSLPQVLDAVCAGRPTARVVVQPHLLFAGQLQMAIERQVEEARVRYPNCSLVTGQPLGPHRLIAQAVADRLREQEHLGTGTSLP
ncbi:sirohydrochlorin chelatase [Roseimaritima ulvae]|uniref:Sirohydrochlorin cobaltochelatase n=1 Tax=Roseimaritima ulvae TaxID=980254 RepID=A0A5B9QI33_9BACT|nr:sirohydrochlorin chelatase [Roseimaritima ulvae]QEG38524.1 Sirohydrochlorin cobaltochelatase [Roseimaritima ulvae]